MSPVIFVAAPTPTHVIIVATGGKFTNETQQLVKVLVLESQRGSQHYSKRCLRHDPGLEPRPKSIISKIRGRPRVSNRGVGVVMPAILVSLAPGLAETGRPPEQKAEMS